MPEPKDNNKETPTSDDSKNTDKGESKAFDPKSLGEDDFNKIFDDPRIWQHNRFKELTEAAKELKELKKAEESRKEKELEEQQKYKELAEKAKTERDEAYKRINEEKINTKIILEATKAGVVDPDAVLKLIDRAKVTVEDSGNVLGVEESIKALIDTKPYLKGGEKQIPNLGSDSNPGNSNNTQKFTLSQIQDPKFYSEHRDEIAAAYKIPGAILDDVGQPK